MLTEESRAANFTNERGVDGTIRYLRNVMGLWLLSESLRTWELPGPTVDLTDCSPRPPTPGRRPDVRPRRPGLPATRRHASPDRRACRDARAACPAADPEIVRCILDSLAATFAASIDDAERLSGQRVDVIHIVGGGSQNRLLCQLVADASGRPVVAGPVEATALGNLLVQARTHGALAGDLGGLRARVRAACHVHQYLPRAR